ncbi:MAG: YidC/Oxa1 family membrane protein insertase [Chloroflexaceae bacterium]|nr:YidC/Oxa1 family membrane protein insertase [Chloroflexaceae bacterium]
MAIWSSFVGFLEQALLWFAVLTGSLGLGIIVFTICARVLILPLTLSAIRSGRRMQELQPRFKEVQRRYGKDQKRLQEETVKLYQQYKVNPVGGCLPMLLQLPIFFGVYQAVFHLMVPGQEQYLNDRVQSAIDGNIEPLLNQPVLGNVWHFVGIERANLISDLLNSTFLGLDLGLAPFADNFATFNGFQYLILPVLSVVLQLVQQLMAMPRVQDPQQKMMTQMMLFMPLVFGYISFTFPSGAVLYWVTSSVIGIVQQFVISGTGSLPNYLPFVPVIERWKPPVHTESEGDEAGVTAGEGGSTPVTPRRGFWDVLRPLTELETAPATPAVAQSLVADVGAGGGDTDTEYTPAPPRRQTQKQAAMRRSRRRR